MVDMPKSPEKVHIKDIPEEIGVCSITQPNIPERIKRSIDHINALFPLLNL